MDAPNLITVYLLIGVLIALIFEFKNQHRETLRIRVWASILIIVAYPIIGIVWVYDVLKEKIKKKFSGD